MSDDVDARLAALRAEYQRVSDLITELGWESEGQARFARGPRGSAEWSAGQNARGALRLVKALQAVMAVVAEHERAAHGAGQEGDLSAAVRDVVAAALSEAEERPEPEVGPAQAAEDVLGWTRKW